MIAGEIGLRLVLGIAGALAVSRLMQAGLFDADPAAAGLRRPIDHIAAVAEAVRRVTRIDPVTALRSG